MTDEDLSEEQLEVIGKLAESGALGATAYSTRQLVREIKRHRSALAADGERVRSVVEQIAREEFTDKYDNDEIVNADWVEIRQRIASRAAEQLATAGVGLSDVDRVRLRSVRELLDKQPDVWDLEANLIDRIIGASK